MKKSGEQISLDYEREKKVREGHKLTAKEKEKLGLDKKVQVFWDNEAKKFETEGKKQIDAIPLGMPVNAIISYTLNVVDGGYCPYLGENSYTTTRAELSARLDGDEHWLDKARYFCVGESYSQENIHGGRHYSPSETIVVPVALYVDRE